MDKQLPPEEVVQVPDLAATVDPVHRARPQPSARLDRLGLWLAAFGAVASAAKAVVVKLGLRLGVDAVSLLALRMLVALPFFLLMAWWGGRKAPPLQRGDGWRIAALGFFGYYLASFLDFAGLAYVSATLERLILYLTPTLVLLIGVLAGKGRPSGLQLLALAVSYAGVLLAFGHDLGQGGDAIVLGSVLVFGGALSYAIYLYGSGEVVGRVGAVRLTAYASCVACALCIGQFLALREPASLLDLPAALYWQGLVNGTLCTVAPVLAVMVAIKRIGSAAAAQVGMLGPVSTIVLGAWLLDEALGPWQLAGTGLVLVGVLLVSRQKAA